MTIPLAILAIVLLTAGLTTVFYAVHLAKPLLTKTLFAAVGFLVIAITLYIIGAMG